MSAPVPYAVARAMAEAARRGRVLPAADGARIMAEQLMSPEKALEYLSVMDETILPWWLDVRRELVTLRDRPIFAPIDRPAGKGGPKLELRIVSEAVKRSVACPKCSAGPGFPCRSSRIPSPSSFGGGWGGPPDLETSHCERRDAAVARGLGLRQEVARR